jgi:hypothetical protein
MPTFVKRFILPVNHQEELDASRFPGLVEKTATVNIKNKCISKPQRNKILIIGDSHARRCAVELGLSWYGFSGYGCCDAWLQASTFHAFST